MDESDNHDMKRPFASSRPIGPFITGDRLSFNSVGAGRDWQSMDTSILDAPPEWDWQIDDELAHNVWQLTANTQEVGYGPDPPILLQSSMGFFDNKSLSSSINNWYFTRKVNRTYSDYTTWWQIGSLFNKPEGDPGSSEVLYSRDQSPHPLKSKLTSQQYTSSGAMFTYEFDQWQGEQPTGMMRIPVTQDLTDELENDIQDTPFEQFQIQFRNYNSDYADGVAPVGDYPHPHFRAEENTTQEDYEELFRIAFDYMKRSVKMESTSR